jgi:hypothetical protein
MPTSLRLEATLSSTLGWICAVHPPMCVSGTACYGRAGVVALVRPLGFLTARQSRAELAPDLKGVLGAMVQASRSGARRRWEAHCRYSMHKRERRPLTRSQQCNSESDAAGPG